MNTDSKIVEPDHWDVVIKPTSGLLDFKLKEVWKYRDLLILWVRREFVGAYKQTILGPLWHFISPLFSTLIYLMIFGKIAKLSTDGIPMFLFYNAGYTAWTFFVGCFNSSAGAFTNNSGIFGKVYFPRLIMPLASIVSVFIKFGIQFLLFITCFIFTIFYKNYHPQLGLGLILIPLSLLLLMGIGFGAGIIVSSLTTKYRDLNVFVGFGLQLLMYGTPIVYTFSSLSPSLQYYLSFNPLVAPIEAFKYALFGRGYFSTGSLLYSFIWMFILVFSGLILFNKAEKSFMDII